MVVAECQYCQLLGNVQALRNSGIGHVKMPQLRYLLGDLPIDGNLHERGYDDSGVHLSGGSNWCHKGTLFPPHFSDFTILNVT